MTGLVDRVRSPLVRLLPSVETVGVRRRRVVAAAAAVMLLALAAHVVYAVAGAGASETADVLVNEVGRQLITVCAAVLCALGVRRGDPDRGAWLALAIGWLDGLVGVLAIAAVGIAFVAAPVLAGAEGGTTAPVFNAAYPIGDVLLLALVVSFLGLAGGGRGRAWSLLGAGFALFATADTAYLHLLASGTAESSPALKSLWLIGIATIALASWQRPANTRRHRKADWRILALPFASCTASIGLLLLGALRSVDTVAACFAAAALVVAMVRTSVSVHELRRLAETRRQASTDELTGLPNRRWFDRELRRAIEHARARREELALLVIDLDHFKELNDTLGHHAGDRVLAQLGPRIRTALRGDDHVARLGGDEFAVLLPGAGAADGAGERIAAALSERFSVEGIDLQIAASIGVALFPHHGDDAETLLQRADVAMYQAKAARSGHAFYERDRDRHSRERLELIGELRDAIGTEQIILHFQPKLDLDSGRIDDVEALVRWMHPERGLLGPGAFVPLAEQTGVMRELTEHVLDAALRQIAAWYETGLDLSVAVNVSAATLLDEGWATDIGTALVRHAVPASRLRIEITEDTLMADPERALRVVEDLVAMGIGVSIDDFGTGYSSLGLLKHLPVDELKIDRAFVRDLLHDEADAAIVQSVVDLGRRLGLRTVAEGIEDEETLECLAAYGVTLAQGFHIARPLPADELERFVTGGAVTA